MRAVRHPYREPGGGLIAPQRDMRSWDVETLEEAMTAWAADLVARGEAAWQNDRLYLSSETFDREPPPRTARDRPESLGRKDG